MNGVNVWQAASQNAKVDFKPLIDHYSSLEYSTKYATKAEKGSKSFEKLLAAALKKNELADDDSPAGGVFSSMLAQQTGGRDWTAQEVGHACLGIRTVISSHDFKEFSLATVGNLKQGLSIKPRLSLVQYCM